MTELGVGVITQVPEPVERGRIIAVVVAVLAVAVVVVWWW